MFETAFEPENEITGRIKASKDTGNRYLRTIIAEQPDQHRLSDTFHRGIFQKLTCLHLRMGQFKDQDSIFTNINELKGILYSSIENAFFLTSEINSAWAVTGWTVSGTSCRTAFRNPYRYIRERIVSLSHCWIGNWRSDCRYILHVNIQGSTSCRVLLWVWLVGRAMILSLFPGSDTGKQTTGTIIQVG